MKRNILAAMALVATAGTVAGAAQAQDGQTAAPVAAQPATTQPATGQLVAVAGGRTLQVLVSQAEIKSDINLSNVAVATGGGMLGGLIGAAVDSARAKKAEELITPVRNALAGFDGDTLALDTAKVSFADAEWVKANPEIRFSKDSSPLGKSGMIDANGTGQTAFVEYSYDMSPLFDAVRVGARIEVARKEIPVTAKGKAEKRLQPKNLAYAAMVTSVILLPSVSEDKAVNAAAWAANNGDLARRALALAFSDVDQLTRRTLVLSQADAAAMNNKANKRVLAGGFTGRPQPVQDGSTLLWDGRFIHVQTIR